MTSIHTLHSFLLSDVHSIQAQAHAPQQSPPPFLFFLMWTILKVFIKFVTVLLLFYVLVFVPQGTWDLSFPTRIEPTPSALEAEA